jgi:NADPH2:quinone reductase
VLIHAAAGGTGQAAVRIAKHYGATMTAAAAPGELADGPKVLAELEARATGGKLALRPW